MRSPAALAAAVLLLSTGCIQASWTPVEMGVVPPAQIFREDTEVRGLRMALVYAENASLTGFDFALIDARVTGPVRGVQFAGFFTNTQGSADGLQLGLANGTRGALRGLQLGGGNGAGSAHGLQLGLLVNRTGSTDSVASRFGDLYGAQLGIMNQGLLHGLQTGLYNDAGAGGLGAQLGLLNVAGDLRGAQIGLLNFNGRGFLPFFPLVNFNVR